MGAGGGLSPPVRGYNSSATQRPVIMRPALLLLAFVLSGAPSLAHGQQDSLLASRWVGHHKGRPLQFEFYGDTMLVVDDEHALDYRLTGDSLLATGDTLVIAQWRYVMGHLLLDTPEGAITMSAQNFLARPLTGRWVGPLGDDDETQIEMRLYLGGTAYWRPVGAAAWTQGEWERESRVITFTWPDPAAAADPDAEPLEWRGQYDPIGNNLLLERTVEGAHGTILRRAYR